MTFAYHIFSCVCYPPKEWLFPWVAGGAVPALLLLASATSPSSPVSHSPRKPISIGSQHSLINNSAMLRWLLLNWTRTRVIGRGQDTGHWPIAGHEWLEGARTRDTAPLLDTSDWKTPGHWLLAHCWTWLIGRGQDTIHWQILMRSESVIRKIVNSNPGGDL